MRITGFCFVFSLVSGASFYFVVVKKIPDWSGIFISSLLALVIFGITYAVGKVEKQR